MGCPLFGLTVQEQSVYAAISMSNLWAKALIMLDIKNKSLMKSIGKK
jgi:hypothetical protein